MILIKQRQMFLMNGLMSLKLDWYIVLFYEQVILLLIKQGANVNAKANDGTSILDASDKAGFSNISKTVKANGAE
jgi:hypothetical protein